MIAPKPPRASLHLQERDLGVLRSLFECRVMTTEHVSTLFFESRKEATKKRLQKLKEAGLVGERRRRAYEPAILSLSPKGLMLLREHGVLADYPALDLVSLGKRANVSELTIRHELEVMDVKTAFHRGFATSTKFSMPEFGSWPRLYQFAATTPTGGDTIVRPDGFIRIHEAESDGGLSEHAFFLEVDRSSETLATLVSRANGYLDYYKSGGFAVRNGAARSAYKEYPFRVLMVFKTAERRNNMAECLLQNVPPILTQVCLSTIEEVRADPLGTIWIRPTDYREVITGTPFDVEEHPKQWGYQRQTAREVFVEETLKKQALFSS